MTRSRTLVRLTGTAAVSLLGCSSTHLSVGEDTGAIVLMTDAGGLDGGVGVDARVLGVDARVPGVDAWSPVTTDPDAYVPPTMSEPDAYVLPPLGTDAGGPSTGTDAGPAGVACGDEVCVDPQVCCVSFGGGGTSSRACTVADACMGVAAACDGPEDCASGEACCGMRGMGGGGSASTGCVPDAACRFGRLCHVDSDCTGRDTCCEFMGASVCSPFCP
jgi:hypothetical protein